MKKSLEQIKSYQVHYRSTYSKAKAEGKRVLRKHLQKLSRQIVQLQSNSIINN